MMNETSIVIFERASAMLAEADTIQKVKEFKSLALTAADLARRKGMGEKAIQYARSYALEAERKLGEMLRETERDKGGRPPKTSIQGEPVLPRLSDLGISKKESSRAQQIAELPRQSFDQIQSGKRTISSSLREHRRQKLNLNPPPLPEGKFRVIYADPPWKYGDQLTENYGATKYHYPNMSISELCSIPVFNLTTENAVLFLWVTSPIIAECWPVIKAWGFLYKACFVWDKVKHNFGHYNSVRHEFLLICTKGSCLPDTNELVDSVQVYERTEKHSEKPEIFREIIDKLYPHGKRVELFARGGKKEGWERWGNQINI
jgi:N6-adenosine-specific RNA methylase IME4